MKKRLLLAVALTFVQTSFAQLPKPIRIYYDVIDSNLGWSMYAQKDFSYDQYQNNITEDYKIWDYISLAWDSIYETSNTFDLDGKTTSSETEQFNNTVISSTQLEYTYTASGKVEDEIYSEFYEPSQLWENTQLIHHTYNGEELMEVLVQQWDEQLQIYVESSKFVYSYPSTNEIVERFYYKNPPLTDDWTLLHQKNSTLSNDIVVYELYSNIGETPDSLLPQSAIYYNYNSNGVLDSIENAEVGDNGMQIVRVETFYYNQDLAKDYILVKQLNNGEWNETQRVRYIYPGQLNLNSETRSDLVVYPNPASSVINLNLDGIQNIEIYDLNGVLQINLDNMQTNEEIPVSQLENGMYMVQLNTSSAHYTRFFVKQ